MESTNALQIAKMGFIQIQPQEFVINVPLRNVAKFINLGSKCPEKSDKCILCEPTYYLDPIKNDCVAPCRPFTYPKGRYCVSCPDPNCYKCQLVQEKIICLECRDSSSDTLPMIYLNSDANTCSLNGCPIEQGHEINSFTCKNCEVENCKSRHL